jgi:hypothetical protein
MFAQSLKVFMRTQRKFPEGPLRNMNEAKFATIDKKNLILSWKNRGQVDITLQDRTNTVTFPLKLKRDAGRLLTCVKDGGITSLVDSSEDGSELRVGFDRGVLYFAARSDSSSISTGMAPSEASLIVALIRKAEQQRICSSF